jgi:hypothetical protein
MQHPGINLDGPQWHVLDNSRSVSILFSHLCVSILNETSGPVTQISHNHFHIIRSASILRPLFSAICRVFGRLTTRPVIPYPPIIGSSSGPGNGDRGHSENPRNLMKNEALRLSARA